MCFSNSELLVCCVCVRSNKTTHIHFNFFKSNTHVQHATVFTTRLPFWDTNKKRKVATTKQQHITYTGQSSSQKLRYVIITLCTGWVPQHALENLLVRNNIKQSKIWERKSVYIPPLAPDQPPFPLRAADIHVNNVKRRLPWTQYLLIQS